MTWPWNMLKVINICTIRKLGYGFLFVFHSNYGRIFSRFDTIHERDGHIPTHPATARRHKLRLGIAPRDKRVFEWHYFMQTVTDTSAVSNRISSEQSFYSDYSRKKLHDPQQSNLSFLHGTVNTCLRLCGFINYFSRPEKNSSVSSALLYYFYT